MASGATIFKAQLSIADMDRHYYADHELTIAQHPSETDLRMMVRLCAFALHADERLQFGRGISTEDEPDLWQKNYAGDIELWIDLGQPDEKRVRKACGRAEKVILYTYQEGGARKWWEQNGQKLGRFKNLSVIHLHIPKDIEAFAKRSMQLQCSVQDGVLLLSDDTGSSLEVTAELWKP